MKMVIIGIGTLAQFLIPCYQKLLGDDLSDKVLAIKASSRNLQQVQDACPFPVQVQGAEQALRDFAPDIITIGVRPQQVAGVVSDTLIPYYDFLRREGKKLPIIYSLAPSPTIDYYYNSIGSDVQAVYQFPNVLTSVAGYQIAQVGVAFATFDPRATWEQTDYAAALSFLAPTGKVFELDAAQTSPFLSIQSTTHLFYDMIPLFSDLWNAQGIAVTSGQLASAMRTLFRPRFSESCVEVIPYSLEGVPDSVQTFLQAFLDAWYQGLLSFTATEQIPLEKADRNICGSMESYAMQVQLLSRTYLDAQTKEHATAGGYLEKALAVYHASCEQYLSQALNAYIKTGNLGEFPQRMEQFAFDIVHAVSEHGKQCGN